MTPFGLSHEYASPSALSMLSKAVLPLWQALSATGVLSTILRCPCTFPPEALQGRMLAGVGVPDSLQQSNKGVSPRTEQQCRRGT